MSGGEEAIRALIAARSAGVNVADVEAMVAPLADDVVTFDMIGDLRSSGKAPMRAGARDWLDLYEGPPHWEDRDVTVVSEGDVAFARMLSHVTGHRKDGVDVDMWFRTTLGLRRLGGEWKIVHEHQSEPFDIESGKASLDLKP